MAVMWMNDVSTDKFGKSEMLRAVEDVFQRLASEHERARAELCRCIEHQLANSQRHSVPTVASSSRPSVERERQCTEPAIAQPRPLNPLEAMRRHSRQKPNQPQPSEDARDDCSFSRQKPSQPQPSEDARDSNSIPRQQKQSHDETPAPTTRRPSLAAISEVPASLQERGGTPGMSASTDVYVVPPASVLHPTSSNASAAVLPEVVIPATTSSSSAAVPPADVQPPAQCSNATLELPPNLHPDDTVLQALQKIFPQRDAASLEPVANWLKAKFGVISYADLEVAGSWGDAGMAIVTTDGGLTPDAKTLLRELLGMFVTSLSTPVVGQSPRSSLTAPRASTTPRSTLEPRVSTTSRPSLEPVQEVKPLSPRRATPSEERRVLNSESRTGNSSSSTHKPMALASVEGIDTLGSPRAPTLATVAEEGVLSGLGKQLPGRRTSALERAAAWLEAKFGMVAFADVESIGPMAQAGLTLVADDTRLDTDAKEVLQEVFKKHASVDSSSSGRSNAAKATGSSRRDDFLVVDVLGSGSFAIVHRVVERSSQLKYALKEITNATLADMSYREQIQQEVIIHQSLEHPCVLRCFENFEQSGSIYLLLELAEGGQLYQYMQKEKIVREPEAASFFSDVISGLHYLHSHDVMHRDLKPENILLTASKRAKIADFGWCAKVTAKQFTQECGSPAYFAPEMVDNCGYDHRVDVWAAGILLYEMLVGFSPFSSALTEAETRKKISNMDFGYGAWFNVPAVAQPLLRNLLRREPSERPSLLEVLANSWLQSHVGTEAYTAAKDLEVEPYADGKM